MELKFLKCLLNMLLEKKLMLLRGIIGILTYVDLDISEVGMDDLEIVEEIKEDKNNELLEQMIKDNNNNYNVDDEEDVKEKEKVKEKEIEKENIKPKEKKKKNKKKNQRKKSSMDEDEDD